MNKDNLIKVFSIIVIFLIITIPFIVSAQSGVTSPTGNTGSGVTSQTSPSSDSSNKSNIFTLTNPLKVNSIGELLKSVIQIFTYLVIIFAVIMFIWIGFQYVVNSAQGNAKKIEELHNQLMWLVVGVAIVIGARVVVEVIINTLASTGAVSSDVIDSANKAISGK